MSARTGRRLRAERAVASSPTAMATTENPMSSTPRRRSRRSASSTTARVLVSSEARSARSSRESESCALASVRCASGDGDSDQVPGVVRSTTSRSRATCSTRDCTESRKARSEAGAVARSEESVVSSEVSLAWRSGG